MKKKSEANKIYSALTTDKRNIQSANLLINALALRKTGLEEDGNKLLKEWKEKSADKVTPDWCLQIFNQNDSGNIPANSDQLRLLERLSVYLGTKNK